MSGGTCGAELTGFVVHNFVGESQFDAVEFFNRCVNIYEISKADHGPVFTGDLHNRTDKLHFMFQNIVGKTDLFQKVRTRFFKPADVIGVVNDIHLVGFIILGFMLIGFHKTYPVAAAVSVLGSILSHIILLFIVTRLVKQRDFGYNRKIIKRQGLPETVTEEGVAMNCSTAESMVNRYINRTLSVDELEEFLEHIEECSSCRDELETYFIVHEAMRQLKEDGDSVLDFKELLELDIKKSRRYIRKRKASRFLAGAFICLLILAAAVFIIMMFI